MHAAGTPSTVPIPPPSLASPATTTSAATYPTAERAARALAQQLGHTMAPGGILRDAGGAMVCRGWILFTRAAWAAGDIRAAAGGGYELRPAGAPPAAVQSIPATLGRIITRGTPQARTAAGHLAQNMLATLAELRGTPAPATPPPPPGPQPPAPAPVAPAAAPLHPSGKGAAQALATRRGDGLGAGGWRAYLAAAIERNEVVKVDGHGYMLRGARPAAPAVVKVLQPTIPPLRPLSLGLRSTTSEDEGDPDEDEDGETLPTIPALPSLASAGKDEDQPDRGDPGPDPSGRPGGREDGPAGPDDDRGGGREDDEGERIEITYFPELAERARTLVGPRRGPQESAVLEAILFCGAGPVLAAARAPTTRSCCAVASGPLCTMATTTSTAACSPAAARCGASRRPIGERQRYAACAVRCGRSQRRQRPPLLVRRDCCPPGPSESCSHRSPACARGAGDDGEAP